jgi:hypothetical protein
MTSDVSRANVSPRIAANSEGEHLQRLMDLEAIRQLGAIYPIFVDSKDVTNIVGTFTPDGEFYRGGVWYRGHEELRAFYLQIGATYGVSVHSVHQHAVDIAVGATEAVGVQTGTADVELSGMRYKAGYRYDDVYRRVNDRWLFARRLMRYQYFSSHDALATSLNGRDRVRLPSGEPRAAEIPEELPNYSPPAEDVQSRA